jgi:nicotinate-nucleotide adenylyltransferase
MTRIALFGGAFDPVHTGHLIAAEAARDELALSRVLFAPAGAPPHKPERPLAPDADRVRMLELALARQPAFAVSRVDLERPGPHYTVDALRLVAAEHPRAELYFLMGADSLADLATWRDPPGIAAQAVLVVAPRPGAAVGDLPVPADRVLVLDSPPVGISATDIRRRVREGRTIAYLVPAAVEDYIRRRGLYGAGAR